MKKDKTYLVAPTKKKDVASGDVDVVPLINIFAGIIYAMVTTNQCVPEGLTFWQKFGIGLVFVIVYEIVSFLLFVSILPAIASTFLYAGLLWVICDKFGNQVVRIILKVITAGFVGLLELSIVINRTIKK